MAATFVLGQNVDGSLKLGVRGVSAGLSHNLATLNFFTLNATEQQTAVVASFGVVQQLAEHFDAGNGGGQSLVLDADDFDFFVHLQGTALNTTGHHGATAGDGEDVLDRHEEGLVGLTNRIRDEVIAGLHEVQDGLGPLGVAFQGLQGRDLDDRGILVVFLIGEELTKLHFHELDDFIINVGGVTLVQCHEDVRNAHLASQKHVLLGLRHRAVGSGHDQDSAVHLSGTGDHVLDVVSVARGVHVCVVALFGLVLHVSDVNGDTTLFFFRSLVDGVEGESLVQVGVCVSQNLGDSCGRGGLTVVNVTDGANVYVRLSTLKLSLCHCMSSWTSWWLRTSQPRVDMLNLLIHRLNYSFGNSSEQRLQMCQLHDLMRYPRVFQTNSNQLASSS